MKAIAEPTHLFYGWLPGCGVRHLVRHRMLCPVARDGDCHGNGFGLHFLRFPCAWHGQGAPWRQRQRKCQPQCRRQRVPQQQPGAQRAQPSSQRQPQLLRRGKCQSIAQHGERQPKPPGQLHGVLQRQPWAGHCRPPVVLVNSYRFQCISAPTSSLFWFASFPLVTQADSFHRLPCPNPWNAPSLGGAFPLPLNMPQAKALLHLHSTQASHHIFALAA